MGSDEIMAMTENGTEHAEQEDLNSALRAPLLNVFPRSFFLAAW